MIKRLILGIAILSLIGCGGGGGTTTSQGSGNPPASGSNAAVTSMVPANSSTGVATTSTISVTYNKPMNQSSISFTVKDANGNIVAGTTSANTVNNSYTTATFTPSASLANNLTYTVMLASGLKDMDGNIIDPICPAGYSLAAGTNTCTNQSGNVSAIVYSWSFTTVASATPHIVSLNGGFQHTIALMSDGTVKTWGSNSGGQLGPGTAAVDYAFPLNVPNLSNVKSVTAGGFFNMALKTDGTVVAWGANDHGQLGVGTTTNSNIPTTVSGINNIMAIAGGGTHALALKNDGTVWTWGNGSSGQMGNGVLGDKNSPYQISSLTNVIAIAAGVNHSFAIKNDGTVWSWGNSEYGQVGTGTAGTNNFITVPTQISGLSNVKTLCGGMYHSIALKNDGTVYTWGLNSDGAIGDGTVTVNTSYNDKYIPTQAVSLSNVAAIAANGGRHNIALKADGSVIGWGYDFYGQLGDSDIHTANKLTPVQTNPSLTASFIAAGYGHSMAVKSDGTVYGWGWNASGQLGVGNHTNMLSPMKLLSF